MTLLAIFIVFRLDGIIGSRVALWMFEARKSLGPESGGNRSPSADKGVDFSLWSDERIEAYRQSLAARFTAPVALLAIPKLALKVPVFEGTEEPVLNRGVGWIQQTARPGEAGNVGIAGHRDGFFRCLKDIQIGDRIELVTPNGKKTYRVDDMDIVFPENVGVLAPRRNPALTLVTCYPFYYIGSAPQRFIVHASTTEF